MVTYTIEQSLLYKIQAKLIFNISVTPLCISIPAPSTQDSKGKDYILGCLQ